MRFHPRQFGFAATRRVTSTLPLSTLLLAALCVLLAAPASHAGSQDETRVAILTRVIAASASSSQISGRLSALESRQVKVLLSRLDKSSSKLSLTDSLSQLEHELTLLNGTSTLPVAVPMPFFPSRPKPQYSLSAHEAAQLSGVRTNSYLE